VSNPCKRCNRFALGVPDVLCYWCRHANLSERRRRACVRLGVMRAKHRVRPGHEVVDELEAARLTLHKYRVAEKKEAVRVPLHQDRGSGKAG
jgi:hypothetical protein